MERLTNRQKVFLCLADELSKDGKSSRFMIEKGLFLLRTEECMDKFIKFYNFFPYRYGPFSNISFLDMNRLLSQNLLEGDKKLAITPLGKKALNNLDPKIANLVIKTAHRFGSESQIKEYVYEKYPWYTIKSETPKMEAKKATPGILTIGYEGRDIDEFLNTLLKEGVEVLIDVRYNPFSMKFSFTKNKLKSYLENVGIEYVHMPELGIRGEKRKSLSTGEDYSMLFNEYKNTTIRERKQDIEKLEELGKHKRIVLMCFEHSKDMCHRGIISGAIAAEVTHV